MQFFTNKPGLPGSPLSPTSPVGPGGPWGPGIFGQNCCTFWQYPSRVFSWKRKYFLNSFQNNFTNIWFNGILSRISNYSKILKPPVYKILFGTQICNFIGAKFTTLKEEDRNSIYVRTVSLWELRIIWNLWYTTMKENSSVINLCRE